MTPLSEEQIRNLWVEHGCDGEDAEGFARAIEAALLAEKAQRIERLEAALRCLLEEVRMQLTYSSSPGLDAARAALSQPHPHGG